MTTSFRQPMTWLHTWAGLLFCWALYFMFATGTLGYFDTEIDSWMQPELKQHNNRIDIERNIYSSVKWLEKNTVDASEWIIRFPSQRQAPYIRVISRTSKTDAKEQIVVDKLLDSETGRPVNPRETGGGQILYKMHYLLHYLPRDFGYRLMGVVTLFMFVGLLTGIIIHANIFKDFFTFRPNKNKRSWLDAHNLLSVATLPFQLMITFSGLIFVITLWMPLIGLGSYGFDVPAIKKGLGQLSDQVHVEPSGQSSASIALSTIIKNADKYLGIENISRMDIKYPNDSNATIIITKHKDTVSRYGEKIVLHGSNGVLLEHTKGAHLASLKVAGVFLGLHEGLFADIQLRWLYFLSGLMGMGMVGTGAIYWSVKRQKKLESGEKIHKGYRLVNQLNIGTVIGLPIALVAYFWANRLLPITIESRAEWEVHTLFIVWLLMLLYPLVRRGKNAWFEQLCIATFMFCGLPIINALTTDRHLVKSLLELDWVFISVDVISLFIGLCTGVCAYIIYRRRACRQVLTVATLSTSSEQEL